MDRREALKKIGVGGVTVLGATAIVSSPAFAYTNPTVAAGNPTITIMNTSDNMANVMVGALIAGTCPASSTNAGDIATRTTTLKAVLGRNDGPTTASFGPTTSTTLVVTRPVGFPGGFPGTEIWDGYTSSGNGLDTILVTVQGTYVCTYGTGTRSACVKWSQLFTASGSIFGGVSIVWNGGTVTRTTC